MGGLAVSEDHWARTVALFQAAIERPAAERASFVARAADGDTRLQREVESLLGADASDGVPTDLLQLIALTAGGHDEVRRSVLTPGTRFGPYHILGEAGRGGMGEVYRAHDGNLDRDVALKVLPDAFEADADRLTRFAREAQVLAALDHPHIAVIHGLQESGGRRALVLEFVSGPTLAERIAEGPVQVTEALALALQIADALGAAHRKGIVHRDLKPANVKVTSGGQVKVLDFGLAKTPGHQAGPGLDDASTEGEATRVGTIVGSPGYMSPEQALGHPVDARTDIWAFGCVLFEMLTGRKAFGAAAIGPTAPGQAQEPEWHRLPPSTPRAVRQLLRKCMQSDVARRPQTIDEARQVLERAASRPARVRRALAVGLTAAAVAASGLYLWVHRGPTAVIEAKTWTQLTSMDSATQPALSPDGRLVAFIRGPGTFVSPGQVYVKQLPEGEPVALTADDLPKMGPVFSPDGRRVVYTVNVGDSWDTWEVPVGGGPPRPWLNNASGLGWIAANDLLFSQVRTGHHMGIVVSPADRPASRALYFPAHTGGMAHRSYASPDRRSVLVVEMSETNLWVPCRLVSIDGAATRLVGPSQARCTGAAWSPDGQWMYFNADAGDGFHIWRQRFTGGAPEQLTAGPTQEEGLAVSADGRSLITSVGVVQRSVWLREGDRERQVSLEGYAFWPMLSANDRTVLFRATRREGSGQSPSELRVTDVSTGHVRRLFADKYVIGHDLSADDRVVAAVLDDRGESTLWLGWLDNRKPAYQIPGPIAGSNPRFGRGGELVYVSSDARAGFLERVREDGSDRRRIAAIGTRVVGTVSPDGEWISGATAESGHFVLFSLRGRPPVVVYPSSQSCRLRWSRDGTRIYLSVQYGQASAFGSGRTYVLPTAPGTSLPRVPRGGYTSEAELAAVRGVEILPYGDVGAATSPDTYVFSKITPTRNLFRITLP